MSTYFFKTNINCIGYVSEVKPHLDRMEQSKEIDRWHVDLTGPEHMLEVETQALSPEQVKHRLREFGYEAEFTKPPQSR